MARWRDGEMARWAESGGFKAPWVGLAPENDGETVINIMKSNGLSWSVYHHFP